MTLESFEKEKQKLYDHVGFVEDWVIYPINNCLNQYWRVSGIEIKHADDMEQFNSNGNYYTGTVYRQRFYEKHIYRGNDLTMIFHATGVDGMVYFSFFNNNMEVK